MATSHITVGLAEDGRVSSKVTRPPGGTSSIFSDETSSNASSMSSSSRTCSVSSSSTENSPPPQRQNKPYRMKSNFELGDEQPAQEQIAAGQNRRRSKLSVNPLTGELVGNFNRSPDAKSAPPAAVVPPAPEPVSPPAPVAAAPPAAAVTPTKSGRVPPGGHCSPLW